MRLLAENLVCLCALFKFRITSPSNVSSSPHHTKSCPTYSPLNSTTDNRSLQFILSVAYAIRTSNKICQPQESSNPWAAFKSVSEREAFRNSLHTGSLLPPSRNHHHRGILKACVICISRPRKTTSVSRLSSCNAYRGVAPIFSLPTAKAYFRMFRQQ